MIDKSIFRNLKGRRIYLFWLDEKTGEITDVTSRDDVIQVIRCKACKYFFHDDDCYGDCNNDGGAKGFVYTTDYCSRAERKEE